MVPNYNCVVQPKLGYNLDSYNRIGIIRTFKTLLLTTVCPDQLKTYGTQADALCNNSVSSLQAQIPKAHWF